MKKLLIYTLTLFALAACDNTTEPLFDESASERIDEATATAQQALTGAAEGWLVEYFPQGTRKHGGFNMLMRFIDDERVVVSTELEPEIYSESLYQMGIDRGPTLNFNTYNVALHYFSDPSLDVGDGRGLAFEGDYEFVVEKVSAKEIIMMGKKTRNTIRLTPWTGDWEEYCARVNETKRHTLTPTGMTVGGQAVEAISKQATGCRYTVTLAGNVEVQMPFMVVPDGIRLYQPVEVLGATVRNFSLDLDNNRFVCSDPGVDAEITFDTPPFMPAYYQIEGTYTMRYSTDANNPTPTKSATVELKRTSRYAPSTYYLEGVLSPANEVPYNIVVTYDPATGVQFYTQVMYTAGNGATARWTAHNGGNFATDTRYGMKATDYVMDGNRVVSFALVDNGNWGQARGMIFYNQNPNAWGPAGVNGDNRFYYMTFEKQ